jgi:hypothetical protein
MFKLCSIFSLPLYLVATGPRTIQFLFFFEILNCCPLKQKQSVLYFFTKQNPIHRAIRPYKNIWSGPYNQKVSRGSEIITNFGTQCKKQTRYVSTKIYGLGLIIKKLAGGQKLSLTLEHSVRSKLDMSVLS